MVGMTTARDEVPVNLTTARSEASSVPSNKYSSVLLRVLRSSVVKIPPLWSDDKLLAMRYQLTLITTS
jgi:hypothetical protein